MPNQEEKVLRSTSYPGSGNKMKRKINAKNSSDNKIKISRFSNEMVIVTSSPWDF